MRAQPAPDAAIRTHRESGAGEHAFGGGKHAEGVRVGAQPNPTEIRDWRDPTEWPVGAQPVTRKMQYDDLYRLTRIDYQYSAGDDTWVSPFAAESSGDASLQDSRRAKPSPHVSFAKRVLSQSFQYDWLGNTTSTDDDAKGFYDRSLGTITNGTPNAGPYQLKAAAGGASPRDGALTTKYDDAGDLVGLSVVRSPLATCIGGTSCSQRFAYEWDEVGRMSRARRWDGSGLGTAQDPVPTASADVDLRYAYDATDDRVLKTAVDPQGNQLHTVYVFDSLELRRAQFDGTDFERTAYTESAYLFAHGERLGRLYYAANDLPTLTSGNLHFLLELQDHLGSSALVVDFATSELVEASTYQAYGAAESDYRPGRWDAYRDDYRFTGKEDDVEVGLTYFGKRYLSTALGRWISADPLTVHTLGADPNAYAYVRGRILQTVDPVGLDGWDFAKGVGKGVAGFVVGGVLGPAIAPIVTLYAGYQAVTGDVKGAAQTLGIPTSKEELIGAIPVVGATYLAVTEPNDEKAGQHAASAGIQLGGLVAGAAGARGAGVKGGSSKVSPTKVVGSTPKAPAVKPPPVVAEVPKPPAPPAPAPADLHVPDAAPGGPPTKQLPAVSGVPSPKGSGLSVSSSSRMDSGQRARAQELGLQIIEPVTGQHAEETHMQGKPQLEAIGTWKRAPCGPGEHNCAAQLADRNIVYDSHLEAIARDVNQAGVSEHARNMKTISVGRERGND